MRVTVLSRCVPPLIVGVIASIDGALLGGIAAVITSLGGILAIALSYQHGKAAAKPSEEDNELERLRSKLRVANAEIRALRAEAKLAARDP